MLLAPHVEEELPSHMQAIIKARSNQAFIYPEKLLAREVGTRFELRRSRFDYLLYVGLL